MVLGLSGLLASGAIGLAQAVASRPCVGAIRWDAGTGGEITRIMEETLAPKKYHFRLPWFAEVSGDDSVRIDGHRARHEIPRGGTGDLWGWPGKEVEPGDQCFTKMLQVGKRAHLAAMNEQAKEER